MVDITRDPRWGRVVEGAGEDPYLGSAVAAAKVHGYQGSDFGAPDKMAATVKHFARLRRPGGRPRIQHRRHVDPAAVQRLPAALQGGDRRRRGDGDERVQLAQRRARHRQPVHCSRRSCARSGASAAPSSATTRPCRSSRSSATPPTSADAARLALTAGRQHRDGVQVPEHRTPPTTNVGPQLLAQGKITMAELNDAVRHVLTLKYLAGMFDHPYHRRRAGSRPPSSPRPTWPQARTSADESMVLLNNQNHALPLSTQPSSIAVVGPLADDAPRPARPGRADRL